MDLVDCLHVAAADDRHHEPLCRLHGDADVVAVEIDDRVAGEPGVQLRECLELVRACLDDRCNELLHVDRLEVALLDPGDGRDLPVRAGHVLGDDPTHAAQRLAATFLGRLTARPGRLAHVLLRDAPLRAGAGKAVDVDAELLGNLADERRRASALRSRCGDRLLHGGRFAGRVAADRDEDRADGDDLALRHEDARHDARRGRRDLDGCLVRLDLHERVVLCHLLPLGDEPPRNLAFREAFAEVRELELVRHLRPFS